MKWLIFTDLDGTLLDAHTYSFEAASQSLEFLRLQQIPVIPCTSKTYLEVKLLRNKLQLNHPFIVENGSALFFPVDYFKSFPDPVQYIDEYAVIVLGKPYDEILRFLQQLKQIYKLDIKGFNDMSLTEMTKYTDLPPHEAKDAKQRLFSEPFVLNGNTEIPEQALAYIKNNGFRLLRGNRFCHLLGQTDKGLAVKHLIEIYRLNYPFEQFKNLAIGDSMNDYEMLRAVDIPAVVKKQDGSYQKNLDLPGLIKSPGIGPEGWNRTILSLLQK